MPEIPPEVWDDPKQRESKVIGKKKFEKDKKKLKTIVKGVNSKKWI